MTIGRVVRPLALAPEAVRQEWMRQYAASMVVMGGAYEAFALARSAVFGFSIADGIFAVLYGAMLLLVAARASLEVRTAYAMAGLAVAQIPTFIQLGFAGPSALLPCVVPVLVALFLGARAAYVVSAGGLAGFAIIALLRTRTDWLPPMDRRLADPRLYLNWLTLALGLAAVVVPVVWLVTKLTVAVDQSVLELAKARSAHEAKVRLRVAADQALAKTMDQRHRARRIEASGLLVAGVVHDLRNHLNVLQLWSESLRDDASADGTVRESAARIHGLCAEATRMTRDVFAVARAPAAAVDATCRAGVQTVAAGGVLKRALPADFDLSISCELAEDCMVALDRFALTSTLLELASAAEVTRSLTRRLRLTVRDAQTEERANLAGCAVVIELSLGDAPGSLDSLAAEIAQRGARLLISRDQSGEGVARLLLPRPAAGSEPSVSWIDG
ncbi:MAG TPA: hypothetical protein VEK07_08535 [Polyangiaceae bacterium]|nr:hypothetical protein [Polyangiaceae bacterium]